MQGLLLLLCSIFFIFILPFSTANNFVGEKENRKAIVWQIFRERYPKQVLYFVKVNTNGKLETRTKGIVDKCSDLTCTKKYALTEGPKRGGGELMWATRSAPPVILCLLRAWYYQHWNASVILKKVLLKLTWNFNFKTTEKWQKKKKRKRPAETAVSPRSSPLRTFREE